MCTPKVRVNHNYILISIVIANNYNVVINGFEIVKMSADRGFIHFREI